MEPRYNHNPALWYALRSLPLFSPLLKLSHVALAVASTWDVEAAAAWGDVMGREFFLKGANVQLGPGLNVARIPRNGRNFEYLRYSQKRKQARAFSY